MWRTVDLNHFRHASAGISSYVIPHVPRPAERGGCIMNINRMINYLGVISSCGSPQRLSFRGGHDRSPIYSLRVAHPALRLSELPSWSGRRDLNP